MEITTDTPPAPPREVRIVAVGPAQFVFTPDNAVVLTPALEAALRRHYEHGRERELAAPAGAATFPWPSRYSSWQEYIHQALHDWLYGPGAVWEPGEDGR